MAKPTKAYKLLKDFMVTRELSINDMAKMADVDAGYLHRILSDDSCVPTLPAAVAIEDGTAGAVTVRDWLVVG